MSCIKIAGLFFLERRFSKFIRSRMNDWIQITGRWLKPMVDHSNVLKKIISTAVGSINVTTSIFTNGQMGFYEYSVERNNYSSRGASNYSTI